MFPISQEELNATVALAPNHAVRYITPKLREAAELKAHKSFHGCGSYTLRAYNPAMKAWQTIATPVWMDTKMVTNATQLGRLIAIGCAMAHRYPTSIKPNDLQVRRLHAC